MREQIKTVFYEDQDKSDPKYFQNRIHHIHIPIYIGVLYTPYIFNIRSNNTHKLINEINIFIEKFDLVQKVDFTIPHYFYINWELVHTFKDVKSFKRSHEIMFIVNNLSDSEYESLRKKIQNA